jgi:hypothetical protein
MCCRQTDDQAGKATGQEESGDFVEGEASREIAERLIGGVGAGNLAILLEYTAVTGKEACAGGKYGMGRQVTLPSASVAIVALLLFHMLYSTWYNI